MLPNENYIHWSTPGRPNEIVRDAEAVCFHRPGQCETVQMRIAFRDGSRSYRLLLTRQADRRFSGPCEVIDEGQPGGREVYPLRGVLCDGTEDFGLVLGLCKWPVRGVGDCEWMARFQTLQRRVVDPNACLYDDPLTD